MATKKRKVKRTRRAEPPMGRREFLEKLRQMDACHTAVSWAVDNKTLSPKELYEECETVDWIEWLIIELRTDGANESIYDWYRDDERLATLRELIISTAAYYRDYDKGDIDSWGAYIALTQERNRAKLACLRKKWPWKRVERALRKRFP